MQRYINEYAIDEVVDHKDVSDDVQLKVHWNDGTLE